MFSESPWDLRDTATANLYDTNNLYARHTVKNSLSLQLKLHPVWNDSKSDTAGQE